MRSGCECLFEVAMRFACWHLVRIASEKTHKAKTQSRLHRGKERKMPSTVVVRSRPGERFTQEVEIGKHRLIADEPISYGGSDQGPGPYRYLLAALGA